MLCIYPATFIKQNSFNKFPAVIKIYKKLTFYWPFKAYLDIFNR